MSETVEPLRNRRCRKCGRQPRPMRRGCLPACVFAVGMDSQADEQPEENRQLPAPSAAHSVAPSQHLRQPHYL